MTWQNSRSSGARPSPSRSRRSRSTRCATAVFITARKIRSLQRSSPTRFLTPALARFTGWALFCDCDFLWLGDIAGLLPHTQSDKAVFCVQHDYVPKEATKMDGAVQTVYPRKNWSSLMLFNCAHPSVRTLTPECVNTRTGAYLHRMQWVADADIGALPVTWNWLEGWNEKPASGLPQAVHFTRGGPWFEKWQHVDYGDLWREEFAAMTLATTSRA